MDVVRSNLWVTALLDLLAQEGRIGREESAMESWTMSEKRVIVTQRPGKIINIDPAAPRVFDNYFAPDSKRWWRNGVKPRRDSYRQRCYAAERSFTKKVEHRTFNSIQEVGAYVRTVMEKPFFQRRFPLFRSCVVEYRPGSRSCYGGPSRIVRRGPDVVEVTEGYITMSTWGMRESGEIAVLHELCHAVLPAGHGHDRRWARTFVELVSCAMGFPMKQVLMEELRRQKVPFSPVRRGVASEAQVLRLAACRVGKEDREGDREAAIPF